ncbi:hypothetical protein ACFY41_14955 [Streptomyces syringium]|uniref:hypothetical protein n=1 Tax=Streptomyces syringium TaxID=76729 RepID=UPI0036BAC216
MNVPLWFVVAVVAYLGVKLARPPMWVVIVLLIGGFLLANSIFAGPIGSGIDGGAGIFGGSK